MRVGSLKYLAVLPKIVRYSALHAQKPTVLRELAKALDDPKRAVRKEAVDARSVPIRFSCTASISHYASERVGSDTPGK